jgi:hypothetical protein
VCPFIQCVSNTTNEIVLLDSRDRIHAHIEIEGEGGEKRESTGHVHLSYLVNNSTVLLGIYDLYSKVRSIASLS